MRSAIDRLNYDRRCRCWLVWVRGLGVGHYLQASGREEARRLGEMVAQQLRRDAIVRRRERRQEARRLARQQLEADLEAGKVTTHHFGVDRGLEKEILGRWRRNHGLCAQTLTREFR